MMDVHVCCNDGRNGLFEGRVTAIELSDMTLEHCSEHGCKFTVLGDGLFRLSRRVFKFNAWREWVGNWCWNAYQLDKDEARRLLQYLKKSGRWTCTDGPEELFEWFNKPR